VPLAQAKRHAVLRIVLQALERLDGEAANGVERVPGEMRADDQVREQRQRLWEQRAQGGAAHDGMDRRR